MANATEAGRRHPTLSLPRSQLSPVGTLLRRLAMVLGLLTLVALLAYIGREGYTDNSDGEVSLLDAFYYATVSITTTGYGDIVPVSDAARLVTTVVVTPARIVFLILLVGTTLEILAERTRETYRLRRWRGGLKDHIVVCGYGTKGRSAVAALLAQGVGSGQVVVIDRDRDAIADANAVGLAAVSGSATSKDVLLEAGVATARGVVVAPNRDDTAVLITLTARELNREATIASAVREEENVHLLRQSGANSVISSSGAAGRLLGMATDAPGVVDVLEDLLTVGKGLQVIERPVAEQELGGRPLPLHAAELPIAVLRGREFMRFDDPRAERLEPGDRVVCVHSEGRGR